MSSTNYYNLNADSFIAQTRDADMRAHYDRFLQHVPTGGRLLDAGSGSGRDAAWFKSLHYQVEAFDASPAMVQATRDYADVPTKLMRFEDFAWSHKLDGIWACASLLHVPRAALPEVLTRLLDHLQPEGVLYCSFKRGMEERLVEGRYFNDMERAQLSTIVDATGGKLRDVWETQDVRPGRNYGRWLNALIARKP